MPLGILTDEEFNSEIEKIPLAEVREPNKLGRNGKTETPEAIRDIIAEEKLNGASSNELQELFNVGPASVSAYGNGATSTASYREPDKRIEKHINQVRERLLDKSIGLMDKAFDALASKDLSDVKARDLASIAKDQSVIFKNLIPEQKESGSGVQFIFFAPRSHKEEDYDVIDIRSIEESNR